MCIVPKSSLSDEEHKDSQTEHVMRVASASKRELIALVLRLHGQDSERKNDDHQQKGAGVERHVHLEPVDSRSRLADWLREGMMCAESSDKDGTWHEEEGENRSKDGVNESEVVMRVERHCARLSQRPDKFGAECEETRSFVEAAQDRSDDEGISRDSAWVPEIGGGVRRAQADVIIAGGPANPVYRCSFV